jgi:hypothetical protein
VVRDDDGARFELDGEVVDSLYQVEAPGYSTWAWSSQLTGTATGRDLVTEGRFQAPARADLYLYATGGDAGRLEARGDVYFFDDLLADRFDSAALDIELLAPESAGPDDCALEPRGWIGLRDENAYWYDLVFLPRYDDATDEDYANDPYGDCVGCGTLFVRGVEAGTVCPDFSGIWSGPLSPPAAEDFILTLRDALEVL